MAKKTGTKTGTKRGTKAIAKTATKNQTAKKGNADGLGLSEMIKGTSADQKQKTLKDLLEDGLKDMLSAEKQLVEALPKVAQAAYSEELQDAVEHHLEQTKKHVSRLEKIMSYLKVEQGSKECEAMKGLIKEADEIIKNFPEGPVRDSALIIGAQKVEHYEIASYGSLCELADVLGLNKIHDTLGRTLDEEEQTDQDLTDLAMEINDEAMELSENFDEDEEMNSSGSKSKGNRGYGTSL
jgi:ferritin-like metal-binding protein YciE